MNTNGFNALCFENNGYASIPWEGIKENKFSICVKCLTDSEDGCGEIFSLESLFSVETSNGYIVFKSEAIEKKSEEKIPLRCQNTITAVYDGVKILLYCNSICIINTEVSLDCSNVNFLRIGKGISETVVFKAIIYNRCLDFNEVRSTIARKPTNYYRQIDFTIPINNSEITLNNCHVENYVYSLDCGKGTVSVPEVVFPKNFTLLFSFFVLKNDFCGGVLFKTPNICVEVCDFSDTGNLYLKITHFNNVGNSSAVLKTNCWTDLAIIFSDGEIQVFFNNYVQMRFTRDSSLEKGKIEFGKFSGYINNCHIAKDVLSVEQLQDYFKNPPSDFDKNFLHLYNFAEELLWENNENFISDGAKIILVKGTGAEIAKESYCTPPDSKKNYSAFAKWQNKVIISILVDWVYQMLGVYPNNGVHKKIDGDLEIDENLHEFVYCKIASVKEAQILLSHYDSLVPKELYKLIRAIMKNGTLKKLLYYLFRKDAEQDSITGVLTAIFALAKVASLLLSFQNTISSLGTLSKPPQKKEKDSLFVEKMFLRSGFEIESDKEVIDNKNIAGVLVKNSTRKAYLDVELSYEGEHGEFIVYAENRQGGIILNEKKSVSFLGNKTVKITLDVQPEKFKHKYGKCTEKLHWMSESMDGKQVSFFDETSIDIYFLENEPLEPWGKSINIECLKLCAECADDAGDDSKGFVEDYAVFLKKRNQSLLDDSQSVHRKAYSKCPDLLNNDAIFDSINFARDFLGKKQISTFDLTHSHTIFSQLHGRMAKSAFIAPVFDAECKLLKIKKNDKNEQNDIGIELIDSHYVVKDVVKDGVGRIYDHELNSFGLQFSEDEDFSFTKETNDKYYRESNYLPGSCCGIIYEIDKWKLGSLPDENYCLNDLGRKELIERRVINNNRIEYVYSGRTETDWNVNRRVRHRDQNMNILDPVAVCHSISSYQIDEAIAVICNNPNHNFEVLLDALYPFDNRVDDLSIAYFNATRRSAQALSRALNQNNDFLNQLIWNFCCLASNSPENLHLGNGIWNGVIQECFDPMAWFYYDEEGTYISSEEGIDNRSFDNNGMHRRYGNDVPIPQQNGFYLPNREDGIRIQKMLELNLPVTVILRSVFEAPENENLREYPLIYSSRNRFLYGEHGDVYQSPRNAVRHIFYLINNEWRLLPQLNL